MAAAVALVATACGPIEHKVASTLPPPPPVIEANTSPPNAHADGRFRAIVTPTADLADPGIADPNIVTYIVDADGNLYEYTRDKEGTTTPSPVPSICLQEL